MKKWVAINTFGTRNCDWSEFLSHSFRFSIFGKVAKIEFKKLSFLEKFSISWSKFDCVLHVMSSGNQLIAPSNFVSIFKSHTLAPPTLRTPKNRIGPLYSSQPLHFLSLTGEKQAFHVIVKIFLNTDKFLFVVGFSDLSVFVEETSYK